MHYTFEVIVEQSSIPSQEILREQSKEITEKLGQKRSAYVLQEETAWISRILLVYICERVCLKPKFATLCHDLFRRV